MIFKKAWILFLALVLLLPLSACSQPLAEEITFDPEDFTLRERNAADPNAAGHQILDLFDSYFTDADYGDAYFDENGRGLHINIVKGSSQRENIARFIALADAELEKNGFPPIQTHEVDFSEQELQAQMDRLSEALQDADIPFNTMLLDVQKNRIGVGFEDISSSYQRRVLRHIQSKYVYFFEDGGWEASIGGNPQ